MSHGLFSFLEILIHLGAFWRIFVGGPKIDFFNQPINESINTHVTLIFSLCWY